MIKDKHTLTPKYLLINYALGLLFTAIILMAWNYNELLDGERGRYYLAAIIVSFILFPFSRFTVEKMALQFSTKNSGPPASSRMMQAKMAYAPCFTYFVLPWPFRLVWGIYSIGEYKNAASSGRIK